MITIQRLTSLRLNWDLGWNQYTRARVLKLHFSCDTDETRDHFSLLFFLTFLIHGKCSSKNPKIILETRRDRRGSGVFLFGNPSPSLAQWEDPRRYLQGMEAGFQIARLSISIVGFSIGRRIDGRKSGGGLDLRLLLLCYLHQLLLCKTRISLSAQRGK